jgi:hypothetical protein
MALGPSRVGRALIRLFCTHGSIGSLMDSYHRCKTSVWDTYFFETFNYSSTITTSNNNTYALTHVLTRVPSTKNYGHTLLDMYGD